MNGLCLALIKANSRYVSVSHDFKVFTVFDRFQIGYGRAAAPSPIGSQVEVSSTFLVCAIDVVCNRDIQGMHGLDKIITNRPGKGHFRNLEWTFGAMIFTGSVLKALGLFEVG